MICHFKVNTMWFLVAIMVLLFITIPVQLKSTGLDKETLDHIAASSKAHLHRLATKLDAATAHDCRPSDYELASMSAYELYKLNPEFVFFKKMNKRDVVDMIVEVSLNHDINPAIVLAIAHKESAFRVNAVSHKGAIGLMQLMPETAAFLRVNPYNPVENVIGGIRYFKAMRAKFSGYTTLGLAAYNAGPGAVKRHNGIPPYTETQDYVVAVYDYYHHYTKELDV